MKKLLLLLLLIPLLSFGQIPLTNVTTDTVGNTIGNISRNVGILCTDTNINQWSKKKPVLEHGSPNWWEASNPLYGSGTAQFSINMSALTNGLDDLSYTADSFWDYETPEGDYSTKPEAGFRLGDFRGYDHSSIAPVDVDTYPENNVRDQVSRNWDEVINTASAGLTVSDFGISAYYFGILIEWGTSWENKYVQTVSTALSSGNVSIAFDYHITPFSQSYTGDYRWKSFISSQEITNGDAERWQTLAAAQAAHSGEVIYITPANSTGITGENSGTFNANIDIVPSSSTISVDWDYHSTGSITVDVTPSNMPTTSVVGDTGDGAFVSVSIGATATGDFTMQVTAQLNDTDAPRSCKVTITDDWGEATPQIITINQLANPI